MKQCLSCLDSTQESFCAPCQQELPWVHTVCPRCGRYEAQSKLCALCQQAPCQWNHGFFPFLYSPPISPLILQLKDAKQFHYARILVDLFLRILPQAPAPNLILPVPLHPWRLLRRGYNQSTELAKILSQRLNIPYSPYYIKRLKHGPHQKGSNKKSRQINVAGVFKVVRPIPVSHIALVDDVLTTGETLHSLCQAIRLEYPKIMITVWTMAQTLKKG